MNVKRKVGKLLTTVGASIGVLGAVAMAIRLKIVMGPAMQQVLFYKGLFAAAAILLVLGAVYGRQGKTEELEDEAISSRLSGSSTSTSSNASDALPGHYSTSAPEIPEHQYERRDRENH